jgi:hypothetical protein
MCHYITAILPSTADPRLLAPIFEAHKMGFQQVSNHHLDSQLGSGQMYVLTTSGHCDCGTVLGCLNRPNGSVSKSPEHEIRKLRNKGWSEAKIQRWIEEKERTNEKHLREDADRARAERPQANNWIGFITDLLKSGSIQRVGLLLHWYRGQVEDAGIKISAREKVRLEALTPKLLMGIKEDVLYEFFA